MPLWGMIAAAVAAGAGVLAGSSAGAFALHLTAAVLVVLAAAVAFHRSRRVVAVLALAGVALTGAADAAWREQAQDARLLPRLAAAGERAEVCGGVTARRPRSVEVSARTTRAAGRRYVIREPVIVTGRQARTLDAGRAVCASGRLVPARRGRGEPPLLAADRIRIAGVESGVRLAAGHVREAFSRAAQAALPARQAGLLLGMTDGDVELLDDATMEDFRRTGLAHLVAVSGSNVAVVLVVVMLLVRLVIPRGRWLRALLAAPALGFFAFLTALEPSVLRAVVTAGVVLAVTASGRTADGLRAAAAAFTLLVLVSPELLRRPGFQLSFAATVGLLLWAAPLSEHILRLWRRPAGSLGRAAAIAVATTLSAQAAVAPLLAWHFGQVPAAGGLANLLVAPLAPVIMVGGMVSLTAAALIPALDWAPATLRMLLDAILWVGRTFSDLPAAALDVGVPAAFVLTTALAALLARPGMLRRACALCAVACLALTAGSAAAARQPWCPEGEIRALDVGQGTAVLLRAGDRAVVVDGGPRDGGLLKLLRQAGVRRLDAVYVSHPHADHAEGFVEVLRKIRVGAVYGPVTVSWGMGADIVRAARESGVPVRVLAAGDVQELGARMRVSVLHPEPGLPPERSEEMLNPYSLLLRAEVDGMTVVLPGDVGAEEQRMVDPAAVGADVLVAPHHGSADLDAGFVEAVDAEVTLVTVGADNRYGHPAPKALKLFAPHGPVLRTDRHGSVAVCATAEGAYVVAERR